MMLREVDLGNPASAVARGGTCPPARIAVVSPHLDDAVLSLGASIRRAAIAGQSVTVVTVFGGDPDNNSDAGPWDRISGFATAGNSARARRAEDLAAVTALGATCVWLGFEDAQYADSRSADEVWSALAAELAADALVLVPGFPLTHTDHRWLTEVVLAHRDGRRIGVYGEQPYASQLALGRLRRLVRPFRAPTMVVPGMTVDWRHLRSRPSHQWAKARAISMYRSQIASLGARVAARIWFHELLSGGELVGLIRY